MLHKKIRLEQLSLPKELSPRLVNERGEKKVSPEHQLLSITVYAMERRGNKAVVVYVEDCPTDAELLSRAILQMLPHCAIVHFRDGTLAKSHLASFKQDRRLAVIVVDINLPGMKGDELILWIRMQHRFDDIPVIALSSSPAFKTVQAAQAIGATSFFVKPIAYNDWIDLAYAIQDYCPQLHR